MVAAETSNLNSTKLTNKLPKKLNSWILDQFFSQLFVDLSWSFDPVCANFLCCSGNESIIIILLLVHSNCCRNEFLTVTIFEWQIQSRITPPRGSCIFQTLSFLFCSSRWSNMSIPVPYQYHGQASSWVKAWFLLFSVLHTFVPRMVRHICSYGILLLCPHNVNLQSTLIVKVWSLKLIRITSEKFMITSCFCNDPSYHTHSSRNSL